MQIPTAAILSPPRDYSACLQNVKRESQKPLELKEQTEERDQRTLQLRHRRDTDGDMPPRPAEAQPVCPRCVPDEVLLT